MRSLSLVGSRNYKWWALAAIAVGLFTSVADIGSVIVALPTISDHFHTDLPTAQWVVTGYALAISALLLPMGRLSDMLGRKRVYVVGFGIFVTGAALAGVSTNMVTLIVPRVLMGVGAAMTQGTSMAMIVSAFPGNERGKALGLQMGVVGTGGVAGPVVGGLIVSALGWREVFFTTAILGTVAAVVAQIVLDGSRVRQSGRGSRFDWLGATLSTSVLVTFLLAMSNGPRLGWGSPAIVAAVAAVGFLLATFVWWELKTPAPMLDLRLFKRKLFSLGVSASFISFIGSSSVRFLMPFYLQAVLGYTPRQVGLIIVPAALAMIITGPLSGRLSDRYGWIKFNVGGLMLSATGLFILSRLTEGSPLGMVLAAMVIQSSGTGTFNAPNNSSVLSTVEPGRYGVVSGFLNVIRNSGNVTGIALATAVVTAAMASRGFPPTLAAVSDSTGAGVLGAFTSGLRTAYLMAGGLVLLGVMLSLAKGTRTGRTQPREVEEPPADQDIAG